MDENDPLKKQRFHLAAFSNPKSHREAAIVYFVSAINQYVHAWKETSPTPLANDNYFGPEFGIICNSVACLLTGDIGTRLDVDMCLKAINDAYHAAGFDDNIDVFLEEVEGMDTSD